MALNESEQIVQRHYAKQGVHLLRRQRGADFETIKGDRVVGVVEVKTASTVLRPSQVQDMARAWNAGDAADLVIVDGTRILTFRLVDISEAEPSTGNPEGIEESQLIDVGGTIYVKVRSDWLRRNGLRAGDDVILAAASDFRVLPKTAENIQRVNKVVRELIRHTPE